MPTVPISYECEIPDLHRDNFIVKTQFFFVDLTGKLISNSFSGMKMDFCFYKKQLTLMAVYKRYYHVVLGMQKDHRCRGQKRKFYLLLGFYLLLL